MADSQEKDVNPNQNIVVPFPERKKEPEEGFKGQFSNMRLSDLVQLATQGRMSLILHIIQDGNDGKIYIHEGEIIHAVHDKKTGVDAFYEIMSWRKGAFQTEEYVPPPIQSIDLPWEHLLIEAHRLIDERAQNPSEQNDTKVYYLDNIPEKALNSLKSWADSHSDVVEIGIISPMGVVKKVFHRESFIPESEMAINILQVIPDASNQLTNALGWESCKEFFIKGTLGTNVIICLNNDFNLYVHLSVDIAEKAILKVELSEFIASIRKNFNL